MGQNKNENNNSRYKGIYNYTKRNYYSVNVRFPIEWKTDIQNISNGKIQRFIIDCVGEKIGKQYKPIDLIEKLKRNATEKQIDETTETKTD